LLITVDLDKQMTRIIKAVKEALKKTEDFKKDGERSWSDEE